MPERLTTPLRRVGKKAGRMTYGARQSVATEYFEHAIARVNDMAIVRYEYGNAIIYIHKKRNLEQALAEIEKAAKMKPYFAMEALDAMYAAKRTKEIEALAKFEGSFRAFERKRMRYQKDSNINLYCVLPKECPPFLIK